MVEKSGERTGVLQEYWHNYMEYGDSPKTRLVDNSLLYVTEYLNKQQLIEKYYYDWLSTDKRTILAKFHSEPHSDEKFQTKTEPFHVHPPERAKLNNLMRYPNYHYTDLFSIIEGIFLFHILPSKSDIF